MKNAKIKSLGILFVLCFSIGIILGIMFNNGISSVAEAIEDTKTIQDISDGLFGKVEINECDYLYGLDGNEDFIYIIQRKGLRYFIQIYAGTDGIFVTGRITL